MSDSEVNDDRCAFDQALFMATAHREWRFATAGQVCPAKMHPIIMKEFYRNVLEATTCEGTYLTEDDLDDFYVSTKTQFLERRKPAVEEAVVEAEAVGEAPIASVEAEAPDAPAEAKEAVLNESTASATTVTDEEAFLDEIVGEMEALNAEATEAMLERPMIATAERPQSPTEFAQALNSAYATEIRRLTDGKRATRSATKMRKSGSA